MICIFCGKEKQGGQLAVEFLKDSFTDFASLQRGDGVCDDCVLFFDEGSAELTRKTGKSKLQRMRNYSHFIKGGVWVPLGKNQKRRMSTLLVEPPFPELAAIAVSGQKHIVFKSRRNPEGANAGWVQFEEQAMWCDPVLLALLLRNVEPLMEGFSKMQIESGHYNSGYILKFGLNQWQSYENILAPHRGSKLFALAIFLAQKEEHGNETAIN